jgi:formate hydrogenlyase subunit 4
MEKILLLIAILFFSLFIYPLFLLGIIRKGKALMQNRIGSPLMQPFYDLSKLLHKTQTISNNASWVFLWSPIVGLSTALIAAVLAPWAGVILPANQAASTNFLFILYLLALGKFFTLLAAIDTGSAFGGLGASREATISMLAEPALMLGMGALALGAGSMNMLTIYAGAISPFVAILAGLAFLATSLAELSRMPVDDPTTHLELTMVHEAMILEYSGRSLAIIEYSAALRACIFFGLALQTLLHLWPAYHAYGLLPRYLISLLALSAFGIVLAIAEGVLVKLKWRSVPNFLAFSTVLSVLAALVAAAQA